MDRKEIIAEAIKEARNIIKESVIKTIETTLLAVKTDLRSKVQQSELGKSYSEKVVSWDDIVFVFSKYMNSCKETK